jgi:hypothetical protein
MAGSALQESPYPHTFPNPPHLADMMANEWPQTLREATDRNYLMTGWFYYLGEIALKRLQNRVLDARYGGSSAGRLSPARWEEIASDLLTQLDDWYAFTAIHPGPKLIQPGFDPCHQHCNSPQPLPSPLTTTSGGSYVAIGSM